MGIIQGNQKTTSPSATTFTGLTVLGAGVVGIVGVVAAVIALASGAFVGAGLCLIAAALAFGLLANAMLRK